MKPDPRIYELVKETLPLLPNRTIYIDDLPANCEAGSKAGFLSVLYDVEKHSDFLTAVAAFSD